MERQGAGFTTYKKFNPNPELDLPEFTPFPEYEDWARQKQAGTLPTEFDITPDYDVPVAGATTPGGFEFGTPETIERYKSFYELPGATPTETGMPTETGYPDVLNQIMGTYGIQDPMEALNLLISMSKDEQGLLDLMPGEEPTVEGGQEISYLSLSPDEAQAKRESGEWTQEDWDSWFSYYKDVQSIEKLAGEKAKEETDVQADITTMMTEGLIYEEIWEFLTNKKTGLGLSNSDASAEITEWVKNNNQDIPTTRE